MYANVPNFKQNKNPLPFGQWIFIKYKVKIVSQPFPNV